jgi:hypothetical protein
MRLSAVNWLGQLRFDAPEFEGEKPMIVQKLILCCTAIVVAGQAVAQVELKTYADADGYLDVQR